MLNSQEKIDFLKENFNFEGNLDEIKKCYEGKPFDFNNANYKKLLQISKDLCDKYDELGSMYFSEDESYINSERAKIIDLLFPGHGMAFGFPYGVKVVIGMVDLEGMNYINTKVEFNPTVRVKLGTYVFVANNVEFGEKVFKNKVYAQTGEIIVKNDTWICADVKIDNDVCVPEKSVVALGAHVTKQSLLKPETVILGCPAHSKKEIKEYETNAKTKLSPILSDEQIKQRIEYIKLLGIDGDFSEYIKLLKNQPANAFDPTLGQIFEYTHKLCYLYNKTADTQLKQQIIDTIFPYHGKNLVVGDDIFVDIMGSTVIEDNVTIGNGCTIAGNIKISKNVKVGDNVRLQSIGHHKYYKKRRLPEGKPPKEDDLVDTIIIEKNITIASGSKIIPNIIVDRDTIENEVYTGKQKQRGE